MGEFYSVYKNLGFKFSQEQIENMVASISKSHEQEIDLHEFVRLSQQVVKKHERVISFEDELKMAFNVFDIDVIFHFEDFSNDQKQRLYHGETRENCTRNEVRREDGRMPTRNNRSSEVHRYNSVYR